MLFDHPAFTTEGYVEDGGIGAFYTKFGRILIYIYIYTL